MIAFDQELPIKKDKWHNNRLHFFKYMSEGTAKIVLRNQTLRWSTKAQLNDPFEMAFDLSIKSNKDHIRQKALERVWTVYNSNEPLLSVSPLSIVFDLLRKTIKGLTKEELIEELGPGIDDGLLVLEANAPANEADLNRMLSQIKILSLTIRPDINLMWSHYANSHRGVVLRFRSVPELDSPYVMAKPVKYTGHAPAFYTEEYLVGSFCGMEQVSVQEITDSIIYRKHSDWQYEQEWRISTGNGRDVSEPFQDARFGREELDGVIFGLLTSAEDKVSIRAMCKAYPNVQFMQTRIVSGSEVLGIDLID